MDKEINNNGYDYVDLGLPSGTLWATCNVGASKPSECGMYFQWGDSKGYTKKQLGKDKMFTWDDYKWSIDGSDSNFSKYTIPGTTLELEDDAANANMGGDWHMPTDDQTIELIENTTSTWTTQDGVNGRLFTSKKDTSKSIFIPAAGDAWDGSVQRSGGYGDVWSSMLGAGSVSSGQNLYFNAGYVLLGNGSRCGGLSVRGVLDKKSDISKGKKKNMNEKLNLVDILKDAPEGFKLWSPIIGYCELVEVDKYKVNPIICRPLENKDDYWGFASDGTYSPYDGAECVLFPCKDERNWSAIKPFKCHKRFEPFQKVLRIDGNNPAYKIWTADTYSHYDENAGKHYLTSGFIKNDDEIIPYDGNEDKLGEIVE